MLLGYSLWGGLKEVGAATLLVLAPLAAWIAIKRINARWYLAPARPRCGGLPDRPGAAQRRLAGGDDGSPPLGGVAQPRRRQCVRARLEDGRDGSRGDAATADNSERVLQSVPVVSLREHRARQPAEAAQHPARDGDLAGKGLPPRHRPERPGDASSHSSWRHWVCSPPTRRTGRVSRFSPAYALGGALAFAAVYVVGSPWIDGKGMAIVSPALLSAGLVGAVLLIQRTPYAVGGWLVAALAGGLVLYSSFLFYQGVWLAPRDEHRELEQIGERFDGQGPMLMTEGSIYGPRHFLRERGRRERQGPAASHDPASRRVTAGRRQLPRHRHAGRGRLRPLPAPRRATFTGGKPTTGRLPPRLQRHLLRRLGALWEHPWPASRARNVSRLANRPTTPPSPPAPRSAGSPTAPGRTAFCSRPRPASTRWSTSHTPTIPRGWAINGTVFTPKG